jgi:putative oxygen-independent coproporphyrinogen III oxidase
VSFPPRQASQAIAPGSAGRLFGVYVHYPWCAFRCPYCDFAVSTERPLDGGRYARAIVAELRLRAPGFGGLECRSLYLGGGTPSLWDPDHVGEVIEEARRLGLPRDAEVTLEVNPESSSPGRFAAYRRAGANRLSVGVQSFDAAVLHKLGRRHGPQEAELAVRVAVECFENVTVDLIYGGRRSTAETARADAEKVGRLGVKHVSAYALTLDPAVLAEEVTLARLASTGRIVFPGDDQVLAQARAVRGALRRAGLRRYEISNFARPGFESVHNRLYWAGESYLGVGAGAYGCLHGEEGAIRWANHRAPAPWLEAVEAGRLPTAEEERLGPRELANERVMLGLRTRWGIEESGLPEGKRTEVEALVAGRLAVRRGGRLVLTARGLDLHSAVAERLFG